jgi:hypothetical protein
MTRLQAVLCPQQQRTRYEQPGIAALQQRPVIRHGASQVFGQRLELGERRAGWLALARHRIVEAVIDMIRDQLPLSINNGVFHRK